MNHFSLATLEFENALALVQRYAQTPMGFDALAEIRPFDEEKKLERALAAISETISLRDEKQITWSFGELADPKESLAILKIENSTLNAHALLEISSIVRNALFARSSISQEREFAPQVWSIVEPLPVSLFAAMDNVNKKLLPSGEIDDSASPELRRIRNELNAFRARLTKTLEALMRKHSEAIQDAIVTVRNDRFVVPLKADFRGKISGVAHGFSSSGQTVFIEPLETIEANNELQSLKEKEEREIARVLFELTEMLRAEVGSIELAIEAVALLDAIRAKVEFARSFNAVVPKISHYEVLELIEARHPLLEENLRRGENGSTSPKPFANEQRTANNEQSKEIVPVSFGLTKEKSVMIISGANAGGKTVVLKTAGLLSLMAISGLPVPAKGAIVPFYKSVLADIGDHQSLAANLSTFTSHISNIASMFEACQKPSLVLLDEVGTGTDPEEGSALGVAIVDKFRREKGAQLIASTHYRGLKTYAANDEAVINASVEFDEKTLKPTYRLLLGFAGASSGIQIARRFGIPPDVIESARSRVDISAREAADYLAKIKRESEIAADLRAALEVERDAVAKKFALLEIEFLKKEKERRKEFEASLLETLDGFERQTRAILKEIDDKAAKIKLEKEIARGGAELKRIAISKAQSETAFRSDAQADEDSTLPPAVAGGFHLAKAETTIDIGSHVLVSSYGKVGRVENISNGIAEVLVGAMRLREKLENLKPLIESGEKKTPRGEKLKAQSAHANLRLDDADAAIELNLIGKKTVVVDTEVDRFLDEAYMSGHRQVRIIHGMGTGALRNAVHDFLRHHPHVERYALAPREQGGDGATIVELRL